MGHYITNKHEKYQDTGFCRLCEKKFSEDEYYLFIDEIGFEYYYTEIAICEKCLNYFSKGIKGFNEERKNNE